MTRYSTTSLWIGNAVAVLCMLAFMPWVLGIPGQPENDYARGWMLGFMVVVFYPMVWLGMLIARRIKLRRANEPKRTQVLRAFANASNTVLAIAALVMAYAWVLILP
jgi:hypothetical protein